MIVGLGRAQLGDPLRRLPIGDARIGQPGDGEDARIGLRGDVRIGAIGLHAEIGLGRFLVHQLLERFLDLQLAGLLLAAAEVLEVEPNLVALRQLDLHLGELRAGRNQVRLAVN